MTKAIFRIEMLPALHGDCIFIEYGKAPHPRRMLIDGGPIGAYDALEARINSMSAADRRVELAVMTHVDTDHVDGLLRLFANKPLPLDVQDVWFNGWRHLVESHGALGGNQGEYLSALLVRRFRSDQWNGAFKGEAVVVHDKKPLPEHTLEGGMKITLLSPTPTTLAKMREAWKDDLGSAMKPGDLDAAWQRFARKKIYQPDEGPVCSSPFDGLIEKQIKVDQAAANGSSIAFLAEFEGRSCLFLADAHHDVISESLKRLLKQRDESRLKVDAVKVPHHGSAGNISDELLSLIESPRFLFSTNGAIFKHPDKEAVERIIVRSAHKSPTLFFNYLSETTKCWQDKKLQDRLKYRAEYNPEDNAPFKIEL